MKLNILLALSIIILASGCTSGFNSYIQTSGFTCQDMCELQPHPENITWAVTGTVPECNCTYYADGLPAQPATTISLFSFKEDFESYVAGYDPDIQNSDRWEPTQYLYYTGNSFNPNTELNANVIAGKALKIYDNMGLYQLRTWLKANTTSTPGNNEIISMDIKWISGRIYISLMQNTSYPTSNPKITVIIDTDGKIKSYNGTAYADTGITMSSGVFKTINITLTNQFAHAITDGVHGAVMKNQAQWTDFMKYIIFGTAASHLPVGFGVMEVDNITVLQ